MAASTRSGETRAEPMAECIPFAEPAPARAERRRIAAALEVGQLVALPTETVYGLAARADHRPAVERLRALKGRDAALGLTWHVGERQTLERFPRPSAMARRLAQRYWPGPLTLVLPGVPAGLEHAAQEGWTGVRLPAFGPTAELLAELPFPVVATSANRSGEPPMLEADAVAQAFGPELAFVLDAGRPPLGEASVVLRLGPGRFDLLRPGILDLEALRATAGLRIGFVCTGNTCRSPMAEGIARELLSRALAIAPGRLAEFGFSLRSMGVLAGADAPPAAHAVEVLARQGVDISSHRSQPALPEDIAALDRVYALSARHLEALRLLLPPGRAKHCELLDPTGEEVPDPIGGPLEEYEKAAAAIRRMVERRMGEWV